MRLWTRALLVGAVGLGAGGALGCAEERPPINRVQNNALAKSFFVGDLGDETDNPEFFAQGTVVDVGYGAAQDGLFTSTYAQPVSRIKWQITEDYLIGRLAYERIEDSDGKKGTGNPTAEGQIAYIYPILSHFDIRRDYNPQTGEESNVVVENTSDQTWDKREFMRVDWSRNLNTNAYDYDTLSLIGIYGGVSYEPVSYYVNDPDHADHPEFNVEDGYFDVTNKALATPGVVDLSHLGWGIDSFPACYLENDFFGGSAPAGNCNPVELTIRQAFKKVVEDDFEPQDWDGRRFQAFGAFYVERSGYSRDYGMVDDKWHRFISRYNIWERSHYYDDPESMTGEIACNTPETTPFGADPTRDDDGNGTHDECEDVTAATDVPGSRCDQFTKKCTLPYQLRKEKPVVWHYTKNSNQDYFEGSEWAAHEWDVAMRVAVQSAKYAECTRVYGNSDADLDGLDDACQQAFPLYNGQMDDNQDAIALAREVDDCRNGLAYDGKDCDALAEEIAATRGYKPGVVSIAKMDEMVVLCHGPVEANDPAICGDRRLPADIKASDCDREWSSEEPDQQIVAQCNAAKSVRIGDLRYHQVNVIKDPQTPSPWGIYTDAEDPLTGNKVAASINVWSHVNDLWSRGVVDMIRYIQGELPVEDITDGKYIGDWVAADEASRKNGVAGLMSAKQVDERVTAAAWQGLRGARSFEVQMPSKEELVAMKNAKAAPGQPGEPVKQTLSPRELKKLAARLKDVKAEARATSVDRPYYDARRQAAQNTPTEAAIQTPAMQQLAGVDNADIPAEDIAQLTSIFRGLNPTIRRDLRQAKENALAARGACVMQEAPAPNSMVGLANVLTQKFGSWQDIPEGNEREALYTRMKAYLAQRAQYAVMIHEMGHSVGLRHNFVSSSNAWGYRPQYWQLRTKNGTVTTECHDVVEDGSTCVGPRYYDPPTQEESDQLIHMFMQSSTMDYAGENTQDLVGLGGYDFAAARMFYGEVMSVHASPEYALGTDKARGMLNITDSFGGIVGYLHLSAGGAFDGRTCETANDCTTVLGNVGRTCEVEPSSGKSMCKLNPGEFMHYSHLNKEYGLINDCQAVGSSWEEVEAKFKPAYWDESRHGRWHPVADGQIVQIDGVYTRCRQQPVDYVAYDRMRAATDAETESPRAILGFNFYGGGRAIDQYGRTRVPYAFATDGWADLGNLAVYRHDNGADAYELFNFFITEQETRHIFDNYRRGRHGYSVRSASGRLLWRYNEKMRDGAKGLGLYFNLWRDLDEMPYQEQLAQLSLLFPDNLLASGLAFDHFTRQFQRPQSGPHTLPSGDTVMRSMDRGEYNTFNRPVQLVIPDGATGYFGNVGMGGKLVENRLADDQGEYDRDYTMNAGSYYDKVYAPYLLSESVDNFISDSLDDFVDPRYRSVSMAGMFPEGYRRFLANMLTRDDATRGVYVSATADGAPEVQFQTKTPTRPLGWTSWWSPSTDVCFPGQNVLLCDSPRYSDSEGPAYQFGEGDLQPFAPVAVLPVDSEVDWEQWKFLIVQTLLYIPENQRNEWINQLGIWEIGADDDPAFQNRIEFHSPEGRTYVARTYGRETLFGKTVERGIAARVLEQANEYTRRAYLVTAAGPGAACDPEECVIDLDNDGVADAGRDSDGDGQLDESVWYVPVIENGAPVRTGADLWVNQLSEYEPLLTFIRQSIRDFRMADPTMKGLYD